jgi:hypothetical protein
VVAVVLDVEVEVVDDRGALVVHLDADLRRELAEKVAGRGVGGEQDVAWDESNVT